MKIFPIILTLVVFTVVIFAFLLLYFGPSVNLTQPLTNNTTAHITKSNNDSTFNPSSPPVNITIIENNSNNSNDSQLISGDIIFNKINWSMYPHVEKICIHDYEIAEPNSVINHTFIVFSIDVTVKNPENPRDLYYEMAGIVIEIRQLLGPNSSPNVWGLVNGIDSYNAIMLPYDDRIYVSDHYHPQAYKNEIYLIPGADIYDYHSYTLINNSVVEN